MCKILGFPIGRRALPRLNTRKNARGIHPRAPAKQVKIRRSPPTEAALHPLCRWRSPDRHRDRSGHSRPTVVREHPLPNRSRSGDLDLQRYGPDRQIRPYRLQPPVAGDRQIAIVQDLAILHYRERRTRGTGPRAPLISPASPRQTSSTHDAQATQAPATDASLTSQAYHQTRLPRFDSNAQHPASQTYQ